MTTFFPFTPSVVTSPPFQFQATLDGAVYNVAVRWNVFGARWYVTVTAPDGTDIVSRGLVGSDTGFEITALAWSTGKAVASTGVPHGFDIGKPIPLTISGASPDAYNGLFFCTPLTPTTFSYAIADDPGQATTFGAVSFDLNLIAGYSSPAGVPFTSSLLYRESARRFEVSP